MDYKNYKQLEFRRKFWKLFGASINITDPASNQLVGFIQMKAWKLREDIRIFADKSMQQQVLQIHARSVIDFGATYDVSDSENGKALFSLRRKGLRSTFVRDHWDIVNADGQPLGAVQETSSGLALVRRYVGIIPIAGDIIDIILSFAPLTYTISDANGTPAARLTHRKNPFVVKFGLDTSSAPTNFDARIAVAATALLAVIDASKN